MDLIDAIKRKRAMKKIILSDDEMKDICDEYLGLSMLDKYKLLNEVEYCRLQYLEAVLRNSNLEERVMKGEI